MELIRGTLPYLSIAQGVKLVKNPLTNPAVRLIRNGSSKNAYASKMLVAQCVLWVCNSEACKRW